MAESPYRHLTCSTQQGVLVVVLTATQMTGDQLADEMRQELIAAVADNNAARVVLDFQNVKYLGSAGFRPLLSLYRKLRDAGGRMVFCNLSPEVAEVFLITRLITTSRSSTAPFEQAPDLATALARVKEDEAPKGS
jgi:anti-anti-sigma factor